MGEQDITTYNEEEQTWQVSMDKQTQYNDDEPTWQVIMGTHTKSTRRRNKANQHGQTTQTKYK